MTFEAGCSPRDVGADAALVDQSSRWRPSPPSARRIVEDAVVAQLVWPRATARPAAPTARRGEDVRHRPGRRRARGCPGAQQRHGERREGRRYTPRWRRSDRTPATSAQPRIRRRKQASSATATASLPAGMTGLAGEPRNIDPGGRDALRGPQRPWPTSPGTCSGPVADNWRRRYRARGCPDLGRPVGLPATASPQHVRRTGPCSRTCSNATRTQQSSPSLRAGGRGRRPRADAPARAARAPRTDHLDGEPRTTRRACAVSGSRGASRSSTSTA